MFKNKPVKNEHKVKRTNISIALIGILLIAGIMLTFLLTASAGTAAGVKNDGDSHAVNANTLKSMNTKDAVAQTNIKTKSVWTEWKEMTPAQRNALRNDAAKRFKDVYSATVAGGGIGTQAVIGPATGPCDTTYGAHYFGPCPNYATSQLPEFDTSGNVIAGTGIRKFVDALPELGSDTNGDGRYIPVAVSETFSDGSDYYEIALVEYNQTMHSDLPAPTKLRGYVQLDTPGIPGPGVPLFDTNGNPILMPDGITQARGVDIARYLGPVIVATKDKPVRIKFYNLLSTGAGGDLFIPVDTTVMGAGPFTIDNPAIPGTTISGNFTQNRATLHLHGGHTPWISDGTPHQWITPANETTSYPEGVSVYNVPDMANVDDPRDGTSTFYYTNNQSARLMFYHDHSFGITRLNVYGGEAAGYLINDPVADTLVTGGTITKTDGTTLAVAPGTIPIDQIPLVIQDKSFVPKTTGGYTNMWGTFDSQLAFQDPTWDNATWGDHGQLWFPHVYETLQNPDDPSGFNTFGRWHYAPWFWPPWTVENGPVPNPYYDCGVGQPCTRPWEPRYNPGTPNPSMVAEAFMDTPVVNGVAYPYLDVDPKAYRFRILNAANDRFWNLQLYQASTIVSSIAITNPGSLYTADPAVTITNDPNDPYGTGASATATVDLNTSSATYGQVIAVTLHSVGSNYTLAPNVTIAPPSNVSGTQATATAALYTTSSAPGVGMTEVGMIPAGPVNACVLTPNPGASGVALPTDGREGGIPDPARAGPKMIQIGHDGGFLPAPVVLPNQPVDWNWDQGTFDFGVVNTYNLFLGPAERADVIVDFSQFAGKTLILYSDSPAPVPAADPRLDYYTSDIDQIDIGGAPSTLPGYGPNTRTIMQIRVRNVAPTPFDPTPLDTAIPAAFNASQNTIIVPEARYNSAYNGNFPIDPYVRIQNMDITFTPIGTNTPVTIPFEKKAIHDEMGAAFDRMYGRNGGMMGLEMPPAMGLQTTILYNYVDPPVDVIKESMYATPIGNLSDGTQIWMIAHNGVDSHPMHWHGYDLQIINRVAWDNSIRPPDDNELGWRETITVNPLQNIIIAVRPLKLEKLPFDLPNSIRLLDPTKPKDVILKPPETVFDPNGQPIPALTNHMVNFGWEYVWHCHILEHEEMDLMHALVVGVPPKAPVSLAGSMSGNVVNLNWIDNSTNEILWTVQISNTTANGPWITRAIVPSTTGPGRLTPVNVATSITADVANPAEIYWFRVLATNVVGDTGNYVDPNLNEGPVAFPTMALDSPPSNTVIVQTPIVLPANPTGGLSVTIIPSSTTVQTATGPATINYNVRVTSTENFKDRLLLRVTFDNLAASYQMPLTWFSWSSQKVTIPAGGIVNVPLTLTIPQGTPAGLKAFRLVANSTVWTSRAQGTAVITIQQ